jgi:hypothetical protein
MCRTAKQNKPDRDSCQESEFYTYHYIPNEDTYCGGSPRVCRKCGNPRHATEFLTPGNAPSAVSRWCRSCRSIYGRAYYQRNQDKMCASARARYARVSARLGWRKMRYGLGESEFNALVEKQGGGCAVCGNKLIPGRGTHVDHDHEGGSRHVRGVLCGNCNTGLGKFSYNPRLLRAAADYLEARSC